MSTKAIIGTLVGLTVVMLIIVKATIMLCVWTNGMI